MWRPWLEPCETPQRYFPVHSRTRLGVRWKATDVLPGNHGPAAAPSFESLPPIIVPSLRQPTFQRACRNKGNAVFLTVQSPPYTPSGQLASKGDLSCEPKLGLSGPRFSQLPRSWHPPYFQLTVRIIPASEMKRK